LKFYGLNHYLMNKMSKKIDKILHGRQSKELENFKELTDKFQLNESTIQQIGTEITDLYTKSFRKTHQHLAKGELRYIKSFGTAFSDKRLLFGVKIGVIFMLFLFIVQDSCLFPGNTNRFWQNPGLYVFASIGMVLLFQLTWAVNVWAWSQHGIDYVGIFQLHSSSDVLQIMDDTSSIFLLYTLNLFIYYLANSTRSVFHNIIFLYGCPFFLIVSTIVFYCSRKFMSKFHPRKGEHKISVSVFNFSVLFRCLRAPFEPITFRDTFVGDILTSFTAFIQNFVYATCWIGSGSFLSTSDDDTTTQSTSDFGGVGIDCSGNGTKLFINCLVLVPLWIRFAQCIRNYYDTRDSFPNLWNALKYFGAILVVVYSIIGGSNSNYYLVSII